jgi:hypothetical protein
MASDVFEQLADVKVPPPPSEFDAQLHDKVNRGLVITQFFELFVTALPWALIQFSRAFIGLVAFSVTGRYEPKSKERRR